MVDKRSADDEENTENKKSRQDDAGNQQCVETIGEAAQSGHPSGAEYSASDAESSASASEGEDSEDEYEHEQPVYTYINAERDHAAQCVEVYASGDVFVGTVVEGVKCGPGTFCYANGTTLKAEFTDDLPTGEARLYPAGSANEVIVGVYNDDGQLKGKQYLDGELVFDGLFEDERYAADEGTFFLLGGGRLTGMVDEATQEVLGEATYVYPCGYRGLRGEWDEGAQMLHARYVELSRRWDPTFFTYSQTYTDEYRPNVSTATEISREPLRCEPWETERVGVKQSVIEGANEGLFATRDVAVGEVVSFYSGVRLTHKTVDERSWELNNNTITLNEDVVIDVPLPYDSLTHYRNTLGHKANHSTRPNAKYDVFFHPVFGDIKCIRSIQDVKEGEEVVVDYGYSHETVPDWYSALKT